MNERKVVLDIRWNLDTTSITGYTEEGGHYRFFKIHRGQSEPRY